MKYADDLQLMSQVAAQNREAAARLLSRLVPAIRALCRVSLLDRSEVDETVQNACIEVLRSAPSYKGQSTLDTWAHTITSRVIAKAIRARVKARRRITDLDLDSIFESNEPSVREETPRPIEEYLRRIPEDLRTTLVMRHMLELSIDECAEALDVSRNTVKDRLVRGRAALRRYLRRDLGAPEPGDEP
ncbi:MAG: RNA polymerase sigma factor [Myxococcota bacterium]|nr:RNA polymerase sigma factor [Myxococcota bacterium]